MARRGQLTNDQYTEFLGIGPFGGLDPTTPPYYVAPTNMAAMSNIVPNEQYGGYATVPGRVAALAALLPSTPTGIGIMPRPGYSDLYLFAVTNAGVGEIWCGSIGSIPTQISLPEPLSPNVRTQFVQSRAWVFITNSVDTPIKIDTNLLATYWGIVAPSVAVTGATSGVGPLVGQYYYCETFSTDNDTQESSQGVISAPILAAGTPATGTIAYGGTATAGDLLACAVANIPVAVQVQTGQTLAQAVATLAGQVNLTPNLAELVTASISGTDLIITTTSNGIAGNAVEYYGAVSTGATETVSPTIPTALVGGTAGNSITVDMTATTTDPQVTTRNLYRLGGSLGAWYLINSQPVGDLTPYLDVLADTLVTGQSLTIFRDPPPPFQAIFNYQDRVFGFGTATDPTLVCWTNYNEPWGFNFNTNTQEAGPNDFSDVAVTGGSIGSMGLLLKTRTAYGVVGNSDTTFTVIELFPVGCTSPTSLALYENAASWDSKRGIQFFDGSTRLTISDTQFQQSNIKNLLKVLTPGERALAVGFAYDKMMFMSYPSQNVTFIFDVRTAQWFQLDFALACVCYDPEATVPVIGANLQTVGQVDQWFQSYTNGDLGNEIRATILSRSTDAGAIESDKKLVFCYVEAPVQADAFVNVTVTVNPGVDAVQETKRIGLDTSGTPRYRWQLPDGLEGQELQMQLQTYSLAQVVLHKVSLQGYIVRKHKPSSPTDG